MRNEMKIQPEYSLDVILVGKAEALAGDPFLSVLDVFGGLESSIGDLFLSFRASRSLSLA